MTEWTCHMLNIVVYICVYVPEYAMLKPVEE